jgi:tRNA (guanine-N7-)-methyltransferase
MPRTKHIKIAEVHTFPNVFHYKTENVWNDLKKYFGNDNPVVIELGCGRADYSINLAKLYPDKNFIGIDRKGNRIWTASKNMTTSKLTNAALLIGHAETLNEIIPANSVSEIWITFPDPYPRRSSMKRRLTHPRFLEIYKKILVEEGIVNLKTDDDTLYEYTQSVVEEFKYKLIRDINDLYSRAELKDDENIQTKYEYQHLADGKKIKLISFCF